MLEPSYLSVTWDLCLAISGFTLVHQFLFFGRGHVNQRSSSLQKLEEKNPSELISMFTMLSPIAGSKHLFFPRQEKRLNQGNVQQRSQMLCIFEYSDL